MIDFDEIHPKVAIKHNVLLGKDDPILVTVAINELVLGRYLDLVSERYADASREMTIALQQQVELSKETAGRVITDAADYVAREVRQAVTSAVSDAGAQLRQQIADAQAVARETVANGQAVQAAKYGAIVSAVLAGAAALVAIVALAVVLSR